MRRWIRRSITLLGLVALLGAGTAQAQEEKYFVLASTTSTENSGLFDYILPKFEEKTGIDVRVVAVGTGQALELGRRGDAAALLVHAPAAEKRFVKDGYGADRRGVMHNDFVIVGPASDPAGVGEADTAPEALTIIAEAEAPFASRGDNSGTNKKELLIWQAARVAPAGQWYRALGKGMGPTLNTAAAMNAYTLTDRGTWISFNNRQDLEIVYEGGEMLYNPYGSILVTSDNVPDAQAEAARRWHEWLTSPAAQELIASYRLKGKQLFFPDAQ